jgi:hypothetical protein
VVLHDPSAREVLKKIVKCALPYGTDVHWTDPFPEQVCGWVYWPPPVHYVCNNIHRQYAFNGQLGLASDWAPPSGSASPDDQQIVSACVLMLMNVAHAHVPVSPRGNVWKVIGTWPLIRFVNLLDATAWAKVWPFDTTGTRSGLFTACTGNEPTTGLRPCGWDETQSFLGRVVPWNSLWSSTITVGIGGPGSNGQALGGGDPTEPSMIRVCAGRNGCLAPNEGNSPTYLSQGDGSANGLGVTSFVGQQADDHIVPGVFSVMAAPHDVHNSLYALPASNVASVLSPASVKDVYTEFEAVWFGNIFAADGLVPGANTRSVDLATGAIMDSKPGAVFAAPIYTHMYYCGGPELTYPVAYATQRLCALPGNSENCAAKYLNPCTSYCTGPLDQGGYTNCTGDDGVTYYPLASYLYENCDVEGASCPVMPPPGVSRKSRDPMTL